MNDANQQHKPDITEEQMAHGLNTDENMAGTQLLDDELNEDGEDKRDTEIAELKDRNLRLMAEFDNLRRRTAKERIEVMQTAGKDILQSLLEVMDDMERADKTIESASDVASVKSGVALVFNKLKQVLGQKGLRQMDAKGTDFDPELHEAVTEIPAQGMEGKVVDVVVPGYYLNDKLIRHAKVVVGK